MDDVYPDGQQSSSPARSDGGNQRKGFASLTPERRREIASAGGRAAHTQGVAHEFTPDEARAAGHKGGVAVSQDRAYMARIGRKGGFRRYAKQRELAAQDSAASSPQASADASA